MVLDIYLKGETEEDTVFNKDCEVFYCSAESPLKRVTEKERRLLTLRILPVLGFCLFVFFFPAPPPKLGAAGEAKA